MAVYYLTRPIYLARKTFKADRQRAEGDSLDNCSCKQTSSLERMRILAKNEPEMHVSTTFKGIIKIDYFGKYTHKLL